MFRNTSIYYLSGLHFVPPIPRVVYMWMANLSHVSKSKEVAHDAKTQCDDGFISTEAWSPVCYHCRDRLYPHKLYYSAR